MAITTTPLGFKKPDGNELARGGDDILRDNAQKAQDLIAADRVRLADHATTINTYGNTLTSHGGRLGAVEAKNATQDTAIAAARTNAEAAAKAYADGLVAADRSRLDYVEAAVAAGGGGTGVSNIGIDTDGVPYYETGASGATLAADTDGVPYLV